jgi:predicted O-linked N-acetylglucosamine transferase (SPINDLY family)
LGLHYHRVGQLPEAEEIYQQILQVAPHHPEALHLLGMIAYQMGNYHNAARLIRQALALKPDFAEAQSNLGAVFLAQGQLEEAIICQQTALQFKPQLVEAHNNLGVALHRQGKLEEARVYYQRAITLQPEFADAYHGLGNLLQAQQQFVEAEQCYRHLLILKPTETQVYRSLGDVLALQERLAEAEPCYRQALVLHPQFAEVHDNLGSVLGRQGQLAAAEASYRQAVACSPNFAEAHSHLGNALGAQRKFAEAEICYRQAIVLQPDLVEAHSNLGKVLQAQSKLEEAKLNYRQALTLSPNNAGLKIKQALLLPVMMESPQAILEARQQITDNLSALLESDLQLQAPVAEDAWGNHFYLLYHGLNERDFQTQLATFYCRACPSLLYTAPHCQGSKGATLPFLPKRGQGWLEAFEEHRKIKIGFISGAFLSTHVVVKFISGMIVHLSRDRFSVYVFAASKSHSDISPVIQQHADYFELLPLQLELARQSIAKQQLDILFYPDIGLDAFTYFLAFARLAPVQCTSWGHPVTTGIPTLDYFISAQDLEVEEAQEHYSEKLIRLQHLPSFYYPPNLSAILKTRQHFGLDDQQHIYLCPQSLFKLHPEFDLLLAEILCQDPVGQVILVEGEQTHWTELLKQRLRQTLPAVINQRLGFVPRLSLADYFNLIAIADVMLDPLHFGGGITTLDALAIGIPIVTLPSHFLRGRVAYYCYKQMGMMDCVANSSQEYINIALRLGTDSSYRDTIKARILATNQVLYENREAVQELEQWLRKQITGVVVD